MRDLKAASAQRLLATGVAALLVIISALSSSGPATAAQACSKLGPQKSGLYCVKVNGKLVLKKLKLQKIVVTTPETVAFGAPAFPIFPLSTSLLPVRSSSTTPDVCSISGSSIEFLSVGLCTLTFQQIGSSFYAPVTVIKEIAVRGENKIDVSPIPATPLTQGTQTLTASTTSGLSVVWTSNSPSICQVLGSTAVRLLARGQCSVTASQPGDRFYSAAQPVTITFEVWEFVRSVTDQPDVRDGYQLHFIYVVPSDGVDHKYDTDGSIKKWIDEGQDFLLKQFGRKFPIDSTKTNYDISFLRSRYSSAQISSYSNSACGGIESSLAAEFGVDCIGSSDFTPGWSKYYVFMMDVPMVAGRYCGYAGMPGNVAVVAVGANSTCTGPFATFSSYITKTWIHEVLHGFGIDHAPAGSCDVMQPGGSCRELYLDKDRRYYVGSSALGADLLWFDFWLRS